MIDKHWFAEKIKDRPFVKIELARFLSMPVESIDKIIEGERDFTAQEAQLILDFFGGEGFFSRELSDDQRRLLELSFELTDEEIQYLLRSVRGPDDGQDPDRG